MIFFIKLMFVLVLFIISILNFPVSSYSEMFMWKNEKGTYEINEEQPEWWPGDDDLDCIVWIPEKENKVADELETKNQLEVCKKLKGSKGDALKEEPVYASGVAAMENNEELIGKDIPQKPTEREIKIYCTSKKELLGLLSLVDPEKVINSNIQKQFDITEEELQGIYTKVKEYPEEIGCDFH